MFITAAAGPLASAQPAPERYEPSDRQVITPEDIMGLTDVNNAEISPDGRHLLYVTQPTIATSRPSRSEIWIAPADGSSPARRLTIDSSLDSSPQWSPDGDSVAFLSNRSGTRAQSVAPATHRSAEGQDRVEEASRDTSAQPKSLRQLWLVSAKGGEAQPLTTIDRDIARFRWSPDGRSIAFLAPDSLTARAETDRAAKRDWVDVDAPRDLARLWILDLASRDLKRVEISDRNITELNWSPDGKRLSLRAAATAGLNDHFYHSELLVVDARTGEITQKLFDNVYSAGSWSPDSGQIAFTAPEVDTIGTRVFVADVSGESVRQLGESLNGTIRQLEWYRDNQTLLARATVHTRSTLFSVDLRTGRFSPLLAFDGRIEDFSVADDGSIAFTGSQAERAADAWVYRRGALRPVTDVNPQVRGWDLGAVEEVRWTSSDDGRTIYGVLITPADHTTGVPAKTVVLAHGGPHDSWSAAWQGSWIDWGQMLASHGYVVLLPNPRGSAGQGTDFARGVVGGWGSRDYQDIVDGLDMLVARKITDPSRVGIGGWSYGGFMSAWAVTHDSRFKTAVVGAAPTDQLSMALGTDTPDFIIPYFGLPPSGIARMDASSPMRAIDRVDVPVLVLHGEEDRRVPVTQGLGFYRGLRLLGKDAKMIIYPREPHRISEFEHQLDLQRRVLAWYDAHL